MWTTELCGLEAQLLGVHLVPQSRHREKLHGDSQGLEALEGPTAPGGRDETICLALQGRLSKPGQRMIKKNDLFKKTSKSQHVEKI